ncbi:hypothetical protein Tco_0185126 [Tanacetum coccineum]
MMQSMSMLVKTQDRKVAKTLKTNKDKDLKILEQKTKSKDNDKGSRSNITKHEGTSLQQDKDQNKDSRTKRQSNLNKSKENHFEVTNLATPDKNVKKISNAFLILEDFNPPLYDLPFHKEVLGLGALLSFSSENEEKVFNPGILTSKGVHISLLPE